MRREIQLFLTNEKKKKKTFDKPIISNNEVNDDVDDGL
jgi:hypothetical protein